MLGGRSPQFDNDAVQEIVKAARMLVSPDGKYKVKREIVSLARVGRGGRARGGAGTKTRKDGSVLGMPLECPNA